MEIPRSWPYAGVKSVKKSAKSHILSRPLFFCHGHILEIVTATFKVSRVTFCVNKSRANYIFQRQILAFFVTGTFGKSLALFSLLSRAFQKVSRDKKKTQRYKYILDFKHNMRVWFGNHGNVGNYFVGIWSQLWAIRVRFCVSGVNL